MRFRQMTEDFLNGLSVVSLDASRSVLSSIAVSDVHPWRDLYLEREPLPDHSSKMPSTERAPVAYKYSFDNRYYFDNTKWDNKLIAPPAKKESTGLTHRYTPVELHETVRLCDVEAFRKNTADKARASANLEQTEDIQGDISALSISSSSDIRPVIYRYVDVVKNSYALLEAIHFELFMPDRPDLRFLAVPFTTVPSETVEGDFFRVSEVDLLSDPSFAVKLFKTKLQYPVVWEGKRIERIELISKSEKEGLAYIVKKKANVPGTETAVSEISDRDFSIRETLFPDEDSRKEHSIVRVTMKDLATAHLYPVEPPRPRPDPILPEKEDVLEAIEGLSRQQRSVLCGGASCDDKYVQYVIDKLKRDADKEWTRKKFLKLQHRAEEDPRSEYLRRIDGVRSSSTREGRVVSAVRALSATEEARIDDRLGAFTTYGEQGDLRLMDELFRLGSRYRMHTSRGADTNEVEEMRIDESIILKTLCDARNDNLEECRPLLDCIFGRRAATGEAPSTVQQVQPIPDFCRLQLNEAQTRAIRMYADAAGPRVFCILSPPGSGKTTVAAAMAATVVRGQDPEERMGDVQLLLSKMGIRDDFVYNLKANKKLDPKCPSPFDFFDKMKKEELDPWRQGTQPMEKRITRTESVLVRRGRKGERPMYGNQEVVETKRFSTYEECLNFNRREIILSTVETALQKMYHSNNSFGFVMTHAKTVIIDEASLLTEAALFCIIRRFPWARIVLVGDEKQLAPFMYDERILGQELAGRPALTVAMRNGRVPVVEMNEVYRAPPSLVAPYNKLSYGGKLVSQKAEGETHLSEIGLIHSGMPQLLMIDVNGREERNEMTMSLYNTKEIEVVVRLLKKFPSDCAKEIMIICLYKEQKKKLQTALYKQYKDKQFTVLTVDSAQGKEAPIVILMTTRTERATNFFCSTERCNVAVSRQQKALIILGKAPLLITHKPWSTVVNGDDFTRIKAEEI